MMTDKTHKLLYYPNIEFKDEDYAWLIRSALLWDEIYRIVPEGYKPQDNDTIKSLSESGEIGKHLIIKPFECDIEKGWDIEQIRDQATNDFLNDFQGLLENFKYTNPDWKNNITRFFCTKADVSLMRKLRQYDLILDTYHYDSEFVYIPKVIGDIYMSYLSDIIADKKGMSMATPKQSSWEASSRLFPVDKEQNDMQNNGFEYLPIYINDIIPENCTEIAPKELLDFRKKRRDVRQEFLITYEKLCKSITQAPDTDSFKDIWNAEARKVEQAAKEYKKSCDLLKVSKWCGRIALPVKFVSGIFDIFDICDKAQPIFKATAGVLDIGKSYFYKKHIKYSQAHNSPYNYLFEVHNFVSPKKRIKVKTNKLD